MSSTRPFIDSSGALDTDQLLVEAVPIAKLVALVAGVALVPLAFVFLLGGPSPVSIVFVVIGQFVLAVGGGLVLLYIVTRAIHLANDRPGERDGGRRET